MHIVVIGGTGMLSGVSLARMQAGDTVSVLARSASSLAMLQRDADGLAGMFHPIVADYSNGDLLQQKLEEAVYYHGVFSYAFCWIHSTAPHAPAVVASLLARTSPECVYVDICGSAVANPELPKESNERFVRVYPTLQYRKVVLGFVIENKGSRWLTHQEISAGVLQAKQSKNDIVVGTVRPWSARP